MVITRQVQSFIARHQLLRPGDRLGVAVSGGADSVALLHALVELKAELGIVLSAVHFNHKLRGNASDEDERFVRGRAEQLGLELHLSQADTKQFARERDLGLEAAGRELRYSYFGRLIKEGLLDKVATAHTLDDQAETVLLRVFRGTGTSGLSGIHPRLIVGPRTGDWKGIIRPFLSTRRGEIESYLREKRQPWRIDSTNAETVFTRNRLRHELLPQLARSFNPDIAVALANLAEIARAEDEFWASETAAAFVKVHRNQGLDVAELLKLPQALQRRVLRLAAIQAGGRLDFLHSERILDLLGKHPSQVKLPNGFCAILDARSLRFETSEPQAKPCGYSYRLAIPGEIALAELGIFIRALVVTEAGTASGYNAEFGLAFDRLPSELLLRNWRPGDRFWPAHTRSGKKVKELLQERHLPMRERALWPVALAGDEIVWVRGFPVANSYVARRGKAVVLVESPLPPGRT